MTDAEKQEKVVSGLEKLREYADSEVHPIVSPDNWGIYSELRDLIDEAEEDAIALLKAQEPRVMTLEEVRDEAEYMFLEKHSKTGSDLYGCAIRGDCDGYGIELLMSEYDCARGRWGDYGKTWRCWTSRPTEAQREATAWES